MAEFLKTRQFIPVITFPSKVTVSHLQFDIRQPFDGPLMLVGLLYVVRKVARSNKIAIGFEITPGYGCKCKSCSFLLYYTSHILTI